MQAPCTAQLAGHPRIQSEPAKLRGTCKVLAAKPLDPYILDPRFTQKKEKFLDKFRFFNVGPRI